MLNLSYRELQALTSGSRARPHVRSGELGDLVPSAHHGGDYVQGGHSVLVLPHVHLPRLVLLAERLAGRVSVTNLSRLGWFKLPWRVDGSDLFRLSVFWAFSAGERSRDSYSSSCLRNPENKVP